LKKNPVPHTPLALKNPFGAPVYYRESLTSTMDEGRILAAAGALSGTVIAAGEQTAGRGRADRPWQSTGGNLFFTILLRFADFSVLPEALTLRTGLAVSLAVEDFTPALCGTVRVKWPNDIMIGRRKAAGILTEAKGTAVFIGVGVNVGQREFPVALVHKATSIAIETADRQEAPGTPDPLSLLEMILARLYKELELSGDAAGKAFAGDWRSALEERLYMKGQRIRFIDGAAGSGQVVEGILSGIDRDGSILIKLDGEDTERSFITGELDVY
jgi:BirA family biotin operon repressor/biotin-[acetyl-CoA-carboxylase] ligase